MLDVWVSGGVDKWMDGQMDGWVYGWMCRLLDYYG